MNMKKRVLSIFRYLLSLFLGFWALSFMESSALYIRNVFAGMNIRRSLDMYESIDFGIAPAVSAAAVFQIFMILIAIALVVLGAAQIMKLHGFKLPAFAQKIYAIKIAKKFDLVILLALAFTLFSFLTMICLAVYAGQATSFFSATNFTTCRLGFGPVWLFLFGIIVSAALFFEDKILALLMKENTAQKSEEDEDPIADLPPAAPIEAHEVTPPEVSAYTAHHEEDKE